MVWQKIFRRQAMNLVCGLGLVFLMVASSGCASLGSYNPATGRRELIFVPTSSEVKMGQQMHGRIVNEYHLATQEPLIKRVDRIGTRIAQVSDRQDYEYRFFVLNKDELNAFTTPGGFVYIFTGLLHRLPGDDAVAAVLAHEIGHCAARHTIKKYQASLGYSFIGNLVLNTVAADASVKKVATLGTDSLMNLVMSAYSRQDELEADRLAVKYMDLAGFKPEGMVETLEILAKEEKGGGTPLFLRTHPYLKDRIAAVKTEIGRLRVP